MIPSAEADRAAILAEYHVSRENAGKLDLLVEALEKWQRVKNLLGAGDFAALWSRHVADSLQLDRLAPSGEWVDLGSGAGFPGLVLAILRPDDAFHLIESNGRKCAFLREAARTIAPNAIVHHGRIEDVVARFEASAVVVSARALAPLAQLLGLAAPLLRKGAVGIFPKGKNYGAELTAARNSWRFEVDVVPSRTDSAGRILRVHGFEGARNA